MNGRWYFPRRCRMDGHTQICRVLSYDGNGYFTILRGEEKVFVKRDRLVFTLDRKKKS